ncbi:hypothetical protein ABZY57_28650 [Streptomyces sp. NPDC006450]
MTLSPSGVSPGRTPVAGLALLGAVTGSFSSWMLLVFRLQDQAEPPGT